MNILLKIVISICRLLLGVAFIFAGFVKAIDPLGYTYKFNDYFTAFGTEWATSLSFSLAVIVSTLEFLVGIAIILNLRPKLASLGALIFMVIFTPITLYIAIANPVSDCGCFGDALVITNWETFWKNIILLTMAIILFKNRTKIDNRISPIEQWVAVAATVIFMIASSVYSYKNLPLIDFRPYNVGTNIPEKMIIPEGAPQEVTESTFIYEKAGEQKEFAITALPDSTWSFVEAKHKVISKGYEPPIHDFTIMSSDGNDYTDMVLNNNEYTFLMITYDLDETSRENIDKVNELAEFAYNNGFPLYALTSSPDETITDFISETEAIYEFYNTDEITLKTIVRSNPGIVVLKNGTIIEKWHENNIPTKDDLTTTFTNQSLEKYTTKANRYYIWTLILASLLVISTYLAIRQKFATKNQ